MKKLLVFMILIAPLSCFGKAADAFTVNGIKVSGEVFERLWQEADNQTPIAKSVFRQKLIDSLVLAKYGLRQFPELNKPTNVGYDPVLTQRLQVNRLLVHWFAFDKQKRQEAASKYLHFTLTHEQLNTAIGKPSLLGYELTPSQRKKAKTVVAAEFALPHQAVEKVTLAQLYDEQSVQGRMAFHQGDLKKVGQFAADRFYVRWYRHQSVARHGLSEDDLAALDKIMEAKYVEPALMLKLGAVTSEHGDDSALDRFKKTVTDAEIAEFYAANKKDFKHVSAAKARLLTFNDNESAQKACNKLNDGADWGILASELGQSGLFPHSRDGWLSVEKKGNDWLSTLAFALPEDKPVNPPVRSPKGLWHLVKVEQKRWDYYAKDSDTVKYQATEAIAKAKAKHAFIELRTRLLKEASISYHE